MELQCPNCAKITTASECPRCGSDLSRLFALQQTAADEIRLAAALLRAARSATAYSHATRSWERRHSPEAAKLAFLAALTSGDFQSATGWHVRAQAPS
jgi:hypothetical protein